ncbi:MAG: TMEM165/GDT1 family protein, partial [bacterium]
ARFGDSLLSSVGVWVGATVGMVLANALAVIVGHVAGRRVPKTLMRRISGVLFIGFGIWTLVGAFL